MFGGIGLYAEDHFFGILAADVLYFKIDDTNRGDDEAAGARPFKPYADLPMTMPYFNVPARDRRLGDTRGLGSAIHRYRQGGQEIRETGWSTRRRSD